MNEYQQARFVSNKISAMFNTIAGKHIVLFGAAFKADSSDTQYSPALAVCKSLLDKHAEVVISDPHALENERIDLGEVAQKVIFEPYPITAAKGLPFIAVLTGWSNFTLLNYEDIFHNH